VAKRGDRISKMPGRDLWRARYTVQTETGPKRKTIYAKSDQECRKALTEAMANADKGLTFDAGSKTITSYLNDWLTGIEGTVRHSTHIRYEGIVNNHISPRSRAYQALATDPDSGTEALQRQECCPCTGQRLLPARNTSQGTESSRA
jgi:hypothetical protein